MATGRAIAASAELRVREQLSSPAPACAAGQSGYSGVRDEAWRRRVSHEMRDEKRHAEEGHAAAAGGGNGCAPAGQA